MIVKAIKSDTPEKYLKKSGSVLSKDYIHKIEHTVYELMHEIVFFDKNLIKGYKKREIKVIKFKSYNLAALFNIPGLGLRQWHSCLYFMRVASGWCGQ